MEFTKQSNKQDELEYVVDLDERGVFKAHVEDGNGNDILSFNSEDEPDGGIWPITAGYMSHVRDVIGLLDYMQIVGLAAKNATLVCVG